MIPNGLILLAARLMSADFPCSVAPGDVRRMIETLTGETCPWPVAPKGYFPMGFVDPRLFYRAVGVDAIEAVFYDGLRIRRVSSGSVDTVKRHCEDFVAECAPVPGEWLDYAALLRLMLAREMTRREGVSNG